jgi:hypothetical protein
MACFVGNGLHTYDSAGTPSAGVVIGSDFISDTSRIIFDGEAFGIVSPRSDTGMMYERVTTEGQVFVSQRTGDGQMTPMHMDYNAEMEQVGIVASDGSNLFVLVQNKDGSVALPASSVTSGSEIERGHIFWNGRDYVLVWTALDSNIRQIHSATVSCE